MNPEARKLIIPGQQTMEEAFPDVDPKIHPYGSRILVQIRCPKTFSDGGINLHPDTIETEKWNTQVAKVIELGPVAFKNRDTLKDWPEGDWCAKGDFVRIPKYGGDRWEVPLSDRSLEPALFVLFNDLDVIGQIDESVVLEIRAFL